MGKGLGGNSACVGLLFDVLYVHDGPMEQQVLFFEAIPTFFCRIDAVELCSATISK